MQYVRLGRTGLPVSRLCLGTMTFGLQCDEPSSRAILDRAASGGITFLDTSDVYPMGGNLETVGRTEEIVGRWLEGRRHDFILATKCFGAMSARPWDQGLSKKHILDAIDASLRRLRTDYVDLYQLHHPDPSTPIDESLRAMDDVVRAGKARYVGCSNFFAYQVARAVGRSELFGLARLDSVQPRYNLLFRQVERELFPLCEEEKIGVIPYNPIAGGLLTGKHRRGGQPTEGTRFTLGSAADRYQDATGTTASSTPSTRSGPSPTRRACRSPSCRWRGCWPSRPSPHRSSAPAAPSSSTTRCARSSSRSTPTSSSSSTS